ncbi:MAG: hypothetical protein ACJAWV_003355 [Flammeovirgaceae bacterium]|jgi:hypothetical protein
MTDTKPDFDPTKINVDFRQLTLKSIAERIEKSTIQLNTERYFQRKPNLWDNRKQSRLIESILIRFPLPSFFFDASDDASWLMIDGLQRLSTIDEFRVKKTLKLQGLEFLSDLNGKGWNEIPEHFQRLFEETKIVANLVLPGMPTNMRIDLFMRINTGGISLNNQEIRHALYQGKPTSFVKRLAEEPYFKKLLGKVHTARMADRDYVTRFLAFHLLSIDEYKSDLEAFMNKGMALLYKLDDIELDGIYKKFSKAMQLAYVIFEHTAFKKNSKSRKNKALFDSVTTAFAYLSEEEAERLQSEPYKTKFKKDFIASIEEDSKFKSAISKSANTTSKVLYRHKKVKEIIEKQLQWSSQ